MVVFLGKDLLGYGLVSIDPHVGREMPGKAEDSPKISNDEFVSCCVLRQWPETYGTAWVRF